MHEIVGDLCQVPGHLWGPSQPHRCVFFMRHSQLRCREGRELDLARGGLLQGRYDEGRGGGTRVTRVGKGGIP